MEKSTPKAQQGPIVLQCETVGQMTAKNSQRQSQGKVNHKWIVLWIRSQKWMPAVASMAKRRRLLRLARGGPTVTLVAYKPFYPKPCHHPSCWSRGFVPAASPPGRPKLLAHFWRSYGWDWLILPGYQTEPGGFYKWPIIPSWWIYHWNNGKTWKTSSNPSLVGISTGISFTEGKLDNDCPPKQFNAQKWLTFYLWQRCPIRNCESEQQCWGCLSCLIQWWQWLLKIWTNWVYFKHMFKQYMYIYISTFSNAANQCLLIQCRVQVYKWNKSVGLHLAER